MNNETTIANEAPSTHIKSEVVAANSTTKIVRMRIPGGESLPTHPAKGHVSIAFLSGEGRVSVDGRDIGAEAGSLIDVAAGAPHSVSADQDVEILVIQTL